MKCKHCRLAVKTGTMGTAVQFGPHWLQIILSHIFCCQDESVSRLLLRCAQHLAGSAPTEIWAGIVGKVLTCQLLGFGTENRVELMLPVRFPWVILTAVESPLLLFPDNQEEPAFFLIPCLPVREVSELLPLQLPGQ